MIYKMARERMRKLVTHKVIKNKNGKPVTHSKVVLQVCEEYFMSLLK